jgi:hypothetical protein
MLSILLINYSSNRADSQSASSISSSLIDLGGDVLAGETSGVGYVLRGSSDASLAVSVEMLCFGVATFTSTHFPFRKC